MAVLEDKSRDPHVADRFHAVKHRVRIAQPGKGTHIPDIGTNIDEFMDDLMPQVEQFSKEQAIASLKMLENNYFHKQEQLVGKMRQEMDHLKDELNKLKV